MKKRSKKLFLLRFAAMLVAMPLHAAEPWLALPATPSLPAPDLAGTLRVNGIDLWFATFGRHQKPPVILLHGGLANANYWGDLVPLLAKAHQVLVVDSRGHGRSGRNATPISYAQMAEDVIVLMDKLQLSRASVVGWSDGAIVGLELAIHHADRLAGVFAFAANSDPSGVKDVRASPVFSAFIARAAGEYKKLNPTPDGFAAFDADIEKMWAREPHYSDATLRGIRARVWIVDGDHDEAIKRENTDHMASLIPGAQELILPGVSHFAFLQDPVMFDFAVQHFLAGK